MTDRTTRIADLKKKIERFNEARDWRQWHKPKNLAMSILIEAAELAEHFQWGDHEAITRFPKAKWREIESELADVLIYCLTFANRTDIDISRAVEAKIRYNNRKYPARVVRGNRGVEDRIRYAWRKRRKR